MFCSFLSICQMSCKSIPCQWSAHALQRIFRQLSALLSPGYKDSKFPLCLCGLLNLSSKSPSAPVPQCPGSSPPSSCEILLPSNTSPQSTLLKSQLCDSSALASPAQLPFCHVCEGTFLSSTPVILKGCALEAASWVRSNKQ